MMKKQQLINMFFTILVIVLFTSWSYGKEIEINGVEDQEIISLITESVSSAKRQQNLSKDSLSRSFIIEKDVKVIKDILASFGYFDVTIEAASKDDTVVFNIDLLDRYRFYDIELTYNDYVGYTSGVTVGEVFDLIGIEKNGYTSTKEIAEACLKLRSFYHKLGFAFVDIRTPALELDRKRKRFKVIFNITLNKKIVLDKTKIIIKTKDEKHQLLKNFVQNRVEWKDGELYNEEKIEQTKDKLMTTGIFSSIDIKINTPVQDSRDEHKAHSEAVIVVEEAKLRDISVGASFGTTEKLGGVFSWSHYNVDGKGSKFSTVTSATKKIQSQRLKYTVYDLFYKRQKLKNQVFISKENVTAYDVKKFGTESILWQEVANKTDIGLGLCSELSKTRDKVEETSTNQNKKYERFKAVGVPMGFALDTTDVFLDPQSGFRCSAMTVPYLCKQHFTSLNVKGSCYLPLSQSKYHNTVVIACYSRLGSMITSKRKSVPRDKLFFAGGANSVRGYGYQLLGNVNDNKKPLGGESVFEIGFEPRIKVTENIGFVTFIEGGNVYNTRMPKLSKKLMWGGGFGVRYYTPLGPIRLDIAFPFKRRKTSNKKNIDSMFNIYISVGQSF